MFSISALYFVLLLMGCKTDQNKTPNTRINVDQLQVQEGYISGVANNQNKVLSFKGIPYAQPPIGALRWKAPQPPQPWEGTRVCEDFAASPMQIAPTPFYMWSEEFLIPKAPINEDALYLNVWTAAQHTDEKRPVFVWIHGGGFSSGSGAVPIYDGTALAQKGVVFVSINYRLGVFGFLAHPELTKESENASAGNYGLLDQIAALEWIKKNVTSFGGDPENITIAGQSAGAASVAYLVASPKAKNLFQKAIVQSASGLLGQGATGLAITSLQEAEMEGIRLAERLEKTSLTALRAMPAAELLQKAKFRGHPVIDGYVLPENVLDIYKKGAHNAVHLMAGWNEQDGILMGGLATAAAYKQSILSQWKEKGTALLERYPATDEITAIGSQKDYQRDIVFGAQTYALANAVSQGENGVYVYRFTRDLPDGEQEDYGAFHTGEVPYVLDNLKAVNRPFLAVDQQLASNLSDYWINFAKTGNPNGGTLPSWPSYDVLEKQIMYLGDRLQAGPMQDAARLDFLLEP